MRRKKINYGKYLHVAYMLAVFLFMLGDPYVESKIGKYYFLFFIFVILGLIYLSYLSKREKKHEKIKN